MTAITIRDVPDDVLRATKVHAAHLGQSLQAYVLELLKQDATRSEPSISTHTNRGELSARERRAERAIRRLSGSATNHEYDDLSTDQLMELLRG